jgi:hypothetical protein
MKLTSRARRANGPALNRERPVGARVVGLLPAVSAGAPILHHRWLSGLQGSGPLLSTDRSIDGWGL